MLDIKVRNKKFNCDITLKHKVSIFIGDSGEGKTYFVKALLDISGGYKVSLSESIHVELLKADNWKIRLNDKYDKTPLFIVDDDDFGFTKEFGEIFNKLGECYLIIISRANFDSNKNVDRRDKLNKMNTISVDGDSFYKFVAHGIEHTIVSGVSYVNIQLPNVIPYDSVLCEDGGSGCTFFKAMYGGTKVKSSDSKDKLISYLIEHADSYPKGTRLFLMVDFSAIGLRLYNLAETLKILGIHGSVVKTYKSFEYMLLRSNMFKVSIEDITKDELMYKSLEDRCTSLLHELTAGKAYAYDKNVKLKSCYTKPCCTVSRKNEMCDRGLIGEKFSALLKGTEFEYLLNLKVVN